MNIEIKIYVHYGDEGCILTSTGHIAQLFLVILPLSSVCQITLLPTNLLADRTLAFLSNTHHTTMVTHTPLTHLNLFTASVLNNNMC